MKAVGLLFIFIACIGTGFSAAYKVKERLDLLYAMSSLLDHIKNEIYLHMTDYSEIFKFVNDMTAPITNIMRECLDSGMNADESAAAAFSSRYAKRLLSDEERNHLSRTISAVAATDIDHAQTLLDSEKSRLDESISDALRKRSDEQRLRISLALYGGLAAVIILI